MPPIDGSNARADERAVTPLRHLPKPVVGAAAAVGAVSAGLILLGACGLGHNDTYVPPPPLNADLQAAPATSTKGTTTPAIVIPPSPTWRVAADQPSRRAPISTITATPDDPAADPSATTRTTLSRPTSTTRPPTTTERPRPTTEPPATTPPPETTVTPAPTTDRPASDNSDG
ncbi:hypothetical protein [Nocardia seriolae]|uniref:Uncharacterized protein n=1 Tax=Nocardia seriolae TaxID=37332 RepID=A0A0B8NEG8_9NOCA|nr:hypothetical protein [Nocardia seriolae]APA96096.1 hypothetical protein NS506_02029 [Nocardia seriolae]MTJ65823.1 hypothetical protein [Nocardia seriolae]MTJ65824.1 hypothetical protein [Nocardia seriolae]MTJ75819.1 hypothetical protein [Nocardia seriolae]MTJ86245.1 hypothetical protein [Nocardia seriolae]